MGSPEFNGETPFHAAFIEGQDERSVHEVVRNDLAFRAQVSGRSDHDQLAHDIEPLGARIVSGDERGVLQRIKDALRARR